MSGIDKTEQLTIIESLASKMDKVMLDASQVNSEVGGVPVSKDVLVVHGLLKEHKLVFEPGTNPNGKWNWSGMHEIKNRGGGTTNPNFKMPDGISTYYGAVKYDYNLNIGTGTKAITHDVIAISPIFLDAKPRAASKNPNSGVYGYEWWNVYIPISILTKLGVEIQKVTGFEIHKEGVIIDESQGLASLTINLRDPKDSPKITMIQRTPILDENDENKVVDIDLTYDHLGTLINVMDNGGEDQLIGGVGFFSLGVSCKYHSGQESPVAGTMTKLSFKMKAFPALSIISGGMRCITYTSASSSTLEY
jgi:hypothetical protein